MKFRIQYLGGPRSGDLSFHIGSEEPPQEIEVYTTESDDPITYKLMDDQPFSEVYRYLWEGLWEEVYE